MFIIGNSVADIHAAESIRRCDPNGMTGQNIAYPGTVWAEM